MVCRSLPNRICRGIMYYSILVIHLNRHSGACALCTYMTYVFVCVRAHTQNQTSQWTNEKHKQTCFHFEMVSRYISLIVHSHFSFGVYSIFDFGLRLWYSKLVSLLFYFHITTSNPINNYQLSDNNIKYLNEYFIR